MKNKILYTLAWLRHGMPVRYGKDFNTPIGRLERMAIRRNAKRAMQRRRREDV